MQSVFYRELMELVRDTYEAKQSFFIHNAELLDIFEGNLLVYIERDLRTQLSYKSFKEAISRAAPINILTKIVDKLSGIYKLPPTRDVVDGTDADKEALEWYVKKMTANQIMADASDLYNLSKSCLIQPFINERTRTPGLRAIPNDRFFVLGLNPVDPMEVTHVVLFDQKDGNTALFHVFTDAEIVTFDTNFDVKVNPDNPEGVNPWGKIPFIYANQSRHLITPKGDTDTLRMTKLVPILLTDLNYAAMYQSFSLLYGIDIDDENVTFAPNAFMKFKSDPTSDKKPEIGHLKPQVDFTETINLIQTQLTMWMDSRGIKASVIGKAEAEKSASGIAKIIDEADTSDHLMRLADYFKDIEASLWDLVMHYAHPFWRDQNLVDQLHSFTPIASVQTTFARPEPQRTRREIVEEIALELESGLTSRRAAIAALNPDFSQEQIDELILEIEGANGRTTESDDSDTGRPQA